MTYLATALQAFFTDYVHTQRGLAANTIASYRDTWRLLLTYLADTTHVSADRIDFPDINVESVCSFLDHLQTHRHNTVATRNARLAAIRAVLTQALPRHLDHAGTITQILHIPPKRHPTTTIEYLTPTEADALINAPDTTRWTGRRDHALFVLAIQTGLRTSELRSLNQGDITLTASPNVTCTGKGRKHRATPLTPTTVTVMRSYLDERATRPGTALFCGPTGDHLSPDALEHRLRTHCATAAHTCPSLTGKHVTMHTLRHTAAMNLLTQGTDITVIALWLGHQHTTTTDLYLHADMTIKQAAIDRTRPPHTAPGTYKPAPDILTWLNTL